MKLRYRCGCAPPTGSGKDLFLASLARGDAGIPWLVTMSLQSLPPSLCVFCLPLSFVRTVVMVFRVHLDNLRYVLM